MIIRYSYDDYMMIIYTMAIETMAIVYNDIIWVKFDNIHMMIIQDSYDDCIYNGYRDNGHCTQ